MAKIRSVKSLLDMHLLIPDYQRPYKWTDRNVGELLNDIENAINDAEKYPGFNYRIGTIILNRFIEKGKEKYYIVDGQQRIITLMLLQLFLCNTFGCRLLKNDFTNKVSQANINSNYRFIKDWFSLKNEDYKDKVKSAFINVLEVVVISVDKESEAFQLFDSQNTRGKALDPHDLLKAYHLREMKNYPYEMQHAVTKWETVDSKKIRELFDLYLFPIQHWKNCSKSVPFTADRIDIYKGISQNSSYTYAKKANKAMPYFQIGESFISGNDFFEMVEHYLKLLNDLESEVYNNINFSEIKEILENKSNNSAGFRYAKNLFFCTVLCYYDRFKNFDERVIKKIFSWAFMLRVDMINLGFDSINKYAIGEYEDRYSNHIPMFSKIAHARLHGEIANMQIVILRQEHEAISSERYDKRKNIYLKLKELNGFTIKEESEI